jgi:phenylpropionate dioxygenase-like ring-hydroxylating dioxygenase large terminal subunit
MKTDDPVALDQWYAIATARDVAPERRTTRLLGQDIVYGREPDGLVRIREVEVAGGPGRPLPVMERYGCIWTSLGHPPRGIFDMAEADEADRRVILCGWATFRTSGLRMVENFLDMAHFPFVHTDILGSEPHTEVPQYTTEVRRDADEVWATDCTFFQSRIAATETSGDYVRLTYRVPSPFVVMLYRVCPSAPNRLDAIAMFIHPLEENLCRAQAVMYLVDEQSQDVDLLRFEQVIFFQDHIIVENQRPTLLPLEPRSEIPTRADNVSVAYRRWLKEKGIRFGTAEGAVARAMATG